MKLPIVAIIDSGIESRAFRYASIRQVRINNGIISEELANDRFGHGSAVASIILKKNPQCCILSIRPGGLENQTYDYQITPSDLSMSIKYAVDAGAKLINVSMGTQMFAYRDEIESACQYALKNNVIIIAAKNKNDLPSLPWACSGVLRVRAIAGNTYNITVSEIEEGQIEFNVCGEVYRIIRSDGSNYFGKGNSYAAAWVTAWLLELLYNEPKDDLSYNETIEIFLKNITTQLTLEEVITNLNSYKIIRDKFFYINRDFSWLGKCALVPFSKEMHALLRFPELTNITVTSIIDPVVKGKVGKDAGATIGIKPLNIQITSKINKIPDNTDSIIVGYLNEVSKYDIKFSIDYILDYALTTHKNIFSFEPVSKEWRDRFQEAGLKICSTPVIDKSVLNHLRECLPRIYPICKPVIGVFGTSSSAGKFTMQLNLRRVLSRKGIKFNHIGTEHHSEIFGIDTCYPNGYANNSVINLHMEERVSYLQHLMSYIDNNGEGDLIIVGGQSWLIPYDITTQTTLRSITLLEGTKPDLVILVVNPYMDPKQYIQDSIDTLRALFRCRTIGLAFSDKIAEPANEIVVRKRRLISGEENAIVSKLKNEFNCECGCITDEAFIENLIETILSQIS